MNRIEVIYDGLEQIKEEWRQLEYIGELTLKRLNINIPKYQDEFIPKGSYKEYPKDAP